MFHMTFVQIGLFDWLRGHMKGKFSKNINLKQSSSQNNKGGEAETWHTCLRH